MENDDSYRWLSSRVLWIAVLVFVLVLFSLLDVTAIKSLTERVERLEGVHAPVALDPCPWDDEDCQGNVVPLDFSADPAEAPAGE